MSMCVCLYHRRRGEERSHPWPGMELSHPPLPAAVIFLGVLKKRLPLSRRFWRIWAKYLLEIMTNNLEKLREPISREGAEGSVCYFPISGLSVLRFISLLVFSIVYSMYEKYRLKKNTKIIFTMYLRHIHTWLLKVPPIDRHPPSCQELY